MSELELELEPELELELEEIKPEIETNEDKIIRIAERVNLLLEISKRLHKKIG